MLGNDEINDNIFKNCHALTNPNNYQNFNSPRHNRYWDVNKPFIGDPNDDNLEIDANDFFNGTPYPIMFGRAHLENGKPAGAYPLVATIESLRHFAERYLSDSNSANWDQRVDTNGDLIINLIDFAIVASRYKGKLNEIEAVADDWLMEEPNDPNGNPKISKVTVPALGEQCQKPFHKTVASNQYAVMSRVDICRQVGLVGPRKAA
jgi:hypothetical protein